MLHIRTVKMEDLYQLIHIENLCFPKEEAATKEAFEKRIQRIPDSFFVAKYNGKVVGLINGPVIHTSFITDGLFNEIRNNPTSGGNQSILGLAVHPDFQKQGVAKSLLLNLENECKSHKRESITLTCKKSLIPFYENFGFLNYGKSDSQHGGVLWYNMVKIL